MREIKRIERHASLERVKGRKGDVGGKERATPRQVERETMVGETRQRKREKGWERERKIERHAGVGKRERERQSQREKDITRDRGGREREKRYKERLGERVKHRKIKRQTVVGERQPQTERNI